MDNENEVNLLPDDGVADEPAAAALEAAPAPETASPTALAEAYDKALAENRELYDRLLRKQAEFDNYRKRSLKEKEDLRQTAAEDLIRSLLPTLDGFDRALLLRDENVPPAFYEGLELIYRGLRDVLARAGVSPVEAVGQIFDPNLHQTVGSVEDPTRREHEIVEELQRGYKLKGRLLRPAMVKFAVGGK